MGALKKLFGAEKIVKAVEEGGTEIRNTEKTKLELEKIAIQTAVGYIASAISQSRFRTYREGREIKEDEYFLWNYSPNVNQNSTQFLWELTETLVYNGEALIIENRGQLFIAEGYNEEQEGTDEAWYRSISVKGRQMRDRKASEVMFFRMDNRRIQPLLSDICRQYEDLIGDAVEGYEKTYSEKGILEIDARAKGTFDDEKKRNDLLNNRFKSFFSNKSAVLPLYSGLTYTPQTKTTRNTSEINDVKELTDEIYTRVGQALRISPVLLCGKTEGLEDAKKDFLQHCVRPIANILEEEATRKRYGAEAYKKGSYIDVDISGIELTNVFEAADKIDKLISCGVYSIDEVREKLSEPLLGTEEAKKHYITKNYAGLGEKGETDEK